MTQIIHFNEEAAKEGMAQLKALAFCLHCGRPFVRQWIPNFKKWSRVCSTCLLQKIFEMGPGDE